MQYFLICLHDILENIGTNMRRLKKKERVIKPLRKCHCGEMSYGYLKVEDAVHCNYCGAMYLIDFTANPVATIELINVDA
jgi:hypothetical protein